MQLTLEGISLPAALVREVDAATLAEWLDGRDAPFGLDVETTGLDWQHATLATLQVGDDRECLVYDCRPMSETERTVIAAALGRIAARDLTVIGHNLKFDCLWLRRVFGVRFTRLDDTMLNAQLLLGRPCTASPGNAPGAAYPDDDDSEDADEEDEGDEGDTAQRRAQKVSLEETAARYGIAVCKDLQRVFVEAPDATLTPPILAYCAQDVQVPCAILNRQYYELVADGLEAVHRLECQALVALIDMQFAGLQVDTVGWRAYLARETDRAGAHASAVQAALSPAWATAYQRHYETETSCYRAWCAERDAFKASQNGRYSGADGRVQRARDLRAWKDAHPCPQLPRVPLARKNPDGGLNLASPQQVREALHLAGIRVADTSQTSIARARRALTPNDPRRATLDHLLEWKHSNKLLAAFGENILTLVDSQGRIHPDFRQLGTRTGRMSCSAPNFQQLPRDNKAADDSIRRHIIAAPGHVLCTADFSNIELRILAEMAQDPVMLQAFAAGGDIHCATTRALFHIEGTDAEIKEHHDTLRSRAKVLNFAIVYGMGPESLADALNITQNEAHAIMERYRQTYAGAWRWLQTIAQEGMRRGYSVTLSGRRRYLSNPANPNTQYSLWQYYEGRNRRQAANSPIQGTSADITKQALAYLAHDLPPDARLVNCVHDEIVVECPEREAPAIAAILAQAMHRAAAQYLTTVANPLPEVSIAPYWKKA